ncbi:unnamed protein product [Rodentolepis nana]|uniref:Spb1_C domain-containing protein n=1 Tax=Rodentolepis nana TaxID=102285 RepID=A0A0R3TE75_RODNA|nr:unnamed protein product [Rodentolepis nana]
MKAKKRLESVRRRADNLPDDLTEKEAWGKIKAMYKKAGLLKKKRRPISLVVNTKSGSKATKQQPGKGAKVKLVDKRMKSDLRGQARAAARKRGRGRGGRR